MTKVNIVLDINAPKETTDWIEELEDIIAEELYYKGFRGSLECKNTGNSVVLKGNINDEKIEKQRKCEHEESEVKVESIEDVNTEEVKVMFKDVCCNCGLVLSKEIRTFTLYDCKS